MKKIVKKIIKIYLPASLILFLLSACATSLASIKTDPEKYAGSHVNINAEVALEAPIPFMDYSLYRIDDETDAMFLFTDKKYMIGQTIKTSVHVIGINEKNAENSAAKVAQQLSDFLVDNKITEPVKANSLSKKLVRLIATLGGIAEGSYFLVAR